MKPNACMLESPEFRLTVEEIKNLLKEREIDIPTGKTTRPVLLDLVPQDDIDRLSSYTVGRDRTVEAAGANLLARKLGLSEIPPGIDDSNRLLEEFLKRDGNEGAAPVDTEDDPVVYLLKTTEGSIPTIFSYPAAPNHLLRMADPGTLAEHKKFEAAVALARVSPDSTRCRIVSLSPGLYPVSVVAEVPPEDVAAAVRFFVDAAASCDDLRKHLGELIPDPDKA